MDPIANMLSIIRNALAVSHKTVTLPFSQLKYEIAKILEKEGFVEKVEKKGRKPGKTLEITLKYNNKTPAISGLKKISRQSQRIYTKAKKLKPIKSGYGIAIVSTSQGLMTNKEAKKRKLGGEIICEIW